MRWGHGRSTGRWNSRARSIPNLTLFCAFSFLAGARPSQGGLFFAPNGSFCCLLDCLEWTGKVVVEPRKVEPPAGREQSKGVLQPVFSGLLHPSRAGPTGLPDTDSIEVPYTTTAQKMLVVGRHENGFRARGPVADPDCQKKFAGHEKPSLSKADREKSSDGDDGHSSMAREDSSVAPVTLSITHHGSLAQGAHFAPWPTAQPLDFSTHSTHAPLDPQI